MNIDNFEAKTSNGVCTGCFFDNNEHSYINNDSKLVDQLNYKYGDCGKRIYVLKDSEAYKEHLQQGFESEISSHETSEHLEQ